MDTKDNRAAALIFLISILPLLKSPPRYIFLENVVGFEASESRDLLLTCLIKMGYESKEWHLSPLQFGIPNERPRYYLTAELSSKPVKDADQLSSPQIIKEFPKEYPSRSLKEFLDSNDSVVYDLPLSFLKARKYISQSEIARASDTRSKCFTKAYGHHGLHSGCFLMTKECADIDAVLEDPIRASELLGLRMFSPGEISRLHMFPEHFQFPPNISLQQRWKLLGNSMNIHVVSALLSDLLKC